MTTRQDRDGAIASALYAGSVMHQRLRPKRHRLTYRVFSLLVDLDELPALAKRLRLFSLNRLNLFSLHERDHGDADAGDARPLRVRIEHKLRAAGVPTGGPIRLLTMPRILGYAFNPLSVYFCHAADGSPSAILYEVNNTFGERHSYLLEVDPSTHHGALIVQHCAKQMRVSPFLAQDMTYRFHVEPPSPKDDSPLSIGVAALDHVGCILNARYDARRRPLTDATLLRAFVTHPLLTLKVVAGIHWEALRLFVKGVRPPAPRTTDPMNLKARREP